MMTSLQRVVIVTSLSLGTLRTVARVSRKTSIQSTSHISPISLFFRQTLSMILFFSIFGSQQYKAFVIIYLFCLYKLDLWSDRLDPAVSKYLETQLGRGIVTGVLKAKRDTKI